MTTLKLPLFIIYFLISTAAVAQNYSVALIPDSLLKHADAVLRAEETRLIIHSVKSATLKHKYAYTIFNESGNSFAAYGNVYTDLDRLTEASGRLFDAAGKQIKTVKKKEMEDVAYSGSNLMSDARLKHHNFYYKSYPYTIEYEEEEDYNGIYQFPTWSPVDGYDYSTQASSYIVEMPADYKLRYKLVNGAQEPVVTQKGNTKVLTWMAANMKAIEHEPFQPPLGRLLPEVLVGPDDFEYGGYTGNFGSWDNYGKYISVLCKGRDVLPDNIKNEIHRLTDALATKEEKIKTLYNYLQQNTHYISIQLGIGSLQPFEAKFVAEKKYGDCKALSNYMVSMLKEAGVQAYPAVIYGGENFPFVYDDFPKHYFNHMVTCVPNGKDTIWLECTDQTKSPGYAGAFTGNRRALLVTENGGHLVNTPRYAAADNLQVRKITAVIDENGDLTAEAITHSTGIQQELQHSLFYDVNREEREKYLNKTLNLPTYKVEKTEYKEVKGMIPAMEETLKITSPNYAAVTGKRLFVAPNLFNKEWKLPVKEDRHFDIVFKSSYIDIDSVTITVPAGYTVEALPKDVSINNKFGRYSISFTIKENIISLVRTRQQEEAAFPAADYPALVNFFDTMFKADRSKIVLVKN